jgi:hypothetical protein
MATDQNDEKASNEIFAIDFATLAREIAMDIFPLKQILELHRLDENEWVTIQENPRFKDMLSSMVRDWSSASNTRERIRVKASTGLESQLEIYIRDINDPNIPLAQRVEAGKFLARLGELDTSSVMAGMGAAGGGVTINILTGQGQAPVTIEAQRAPQLAIPVED